MPLSRSKSIESIYAWWAQELGVNVPELMAEQKGVTLSVSTVLPGILAFRRRGDLRIAAAIGKLDAIRDALIGNTHAQIFSADFWPHKLPQLSGSVVGPALLCYADTAPATLLGLKPARGVTVRALLQADARAVAELSASLSEVEREQSGLELGPRPLWGVFEGRELRGAAGYDVWPGRIAHVGVAVHPEHRRKKTGTLCARRCDSRGASEAARGAVSRPAG